MKSSHSFDYDVLIVGAGPSGLVAAKSAARLGLKVGLIEKDAVGGTCSNRGCVPKKLMVYAAEFAHDAHLAKSFAWHNLEGEHSWKNLHRSIQSQLETIRESMKNSLRKAGVEQITGEASFIDPHTLQLQTSKRLSAQHIVLAVGAQPLRLDLPGVDLALTSKDFFKLENLPQSIVIIGGGYIGVELAGILNVFGVEVTLVDTDPQVLDGFDSSLRSAVQTQLQQQGIRLVMEASLSKIENIQSGRRVYLSSTQKENEKDTDLSVLDAEAVLVATGRKPALEPLNLAAAGIETNDAGAVSVNPQGQTSQPHIYAVGDCTDRLCLTPVAKAEAEAAIAALYPKNHRHQATSVDYRWVPSSVYSHPPAASVGWSEETAREKLGDAVTVRQRDVSPLRYSLSAKDMPALIKLVIAKDSEKIVGLHVFGDHAAELVQAMTPVLKRGITFEQLQRSIGIHPTFGEEMLTF